MADQNRRQFLRTLVGVGCFPALSPRLAPENIVRVPPSLMLHSRHWRILPDLLSHLKALDYTGVTYHDWEQAMAGTTALPYHPVILSVDDLSLVAGSPSFEYFERMKNNFLESGFKAVFSIITRPDLPQDDRRWEAVAAWTREGMELATHTAYHSNLDNARFDAADYESEIVDSAAMIEAQTGYAVRSLVTPFGSGYDITTGTLNPNVLQAARAANLGFIVGISTGQRHVHVDTQAGDVIYTGRANPGDQYPVNDALYYVKHW
ncbi:MAG TPA: polysaccharide deacetylase family protein [Phototrophicaceae bacterium]|nr:polysaccharide deacetylase family protein [Phototrophicaceae bacterium]